MSTNTIQSAPPAPSARRLAANRANAQKSTGPRTPEGKRTSSQNARKHAPCPFTFQLPAHFEQQWFHDALRRTAPCVDERARLLLVNRCMLQAHEVRWNALERTLFDTACEETDASTDRVALWMAQQAAYAKGLLSYHRWIAGRVTQVERSLAALAANSAGVENSIEQAAPKTMAAGAAGGGSTFSNLSPSHLGPDSVLPVTYGEDGWSYGPLSGAFCRRVGAPQPPRPPQPPKPPVVRLIRGRYRLYLRCPPAPEPANEAVASDPRHEMSTGNPEQTQIAGSTEPQRPETQLRTSGNQTQYAETATTLTESPSFGENTPPADSVTFHLGFNTTAEPVNPARNLAEQSRTTTAFAEARSLSSAQPADSSTSAFQPIEPTAPSGTPPAPDPDEAAHSPPAPAA
ncbi:hypothetical protein [uncultured Paludibaculum sp.]|uniref:hypothetical protein n=1 Tax=uncultured Paludibaculum sp. TaxID=1765020 RepID=UPI002AAB13E2|nr:hypothetical protein [uncultured Paludibaculum sp.]